MQAIYEQGQFIMLQLWDDYKSSAALTRQLNQKCVIWRMSFYTDTQNPQNTFFNFQQETLQKN
ncbi:hypothetical protein TTHERM_00191970 (macronuclear) [Tetrahymena thermophila SB210]|uniref:Uncharacterized protein n=1 Tax=Tetrahymena thermophila (strain SB210) TaxID=312017 RepID=I7MEK5_TETTS|nr:hypothetical protein TTHERM_00191970 [Tetrahymena thermophila SB210]EAR96528.1 hypothetical protein TTHERM_00191970 [Tetrahymena thermophila SB210]|eukprot:XP_001016773.1 hypothetical protein TTHERM_00191970 [Tetrahymena thermophila SB210]